LKSDAKSFYIHRHRGYVRAEAEFITSEKIIHYAATSPCYYNFLHDD